MWEVKKKIRLTTIEHCDPEGKKVEIWHYLSHDPKGKLRFCLDVPKLDKGIITTTQRVIDVGIDELIDLLRKKFKGRMRHLDEVWLEEHRKQKT